MASPLPIPARPQLQRVFMLHEIVLAPQAQSAHLNGAIPSLPMTKEPKGDADKQTDDKGEMTTIELEGKQLPQAQEIVAQSKSSHPTVTTAANTASVMMSSVQGGAGGVGPPGISGQFQR